ILAFGPEDLRAQVLLASEGNPGKRPTRCEHDVPRPSITRWAVPPQALVHDRCTGNRDTDHLLEEKTSPGLVAESGAGFVDVNLDTRCALTASRSLAPCIKPEA